MSRLYGIGLGGQGILSDDSTTTIMNEWCEHCMRGSTCSHTVEECRNTPELTVEQIYEAMIKCGEANLRSQPSKNKEDGE